MDRKKADAPPPNADTAHEKIAQVQAWLASHRAEIPREVSAALDGYTDLVEALSLSRRAQQSVLIKTLCHCARNYSKLGKT